MTEEGIFLGGGETAGMFKDWTIPSFDSILRGGNGAHSASYGDGSFAHKNCTGVFKIYPGNEPNKYCDRFAGSYYANWNTDKLLFSFRNITDKTNNSNNLYPKHYNVEWWIKYK